MAGVTVTQTRGYLPDRRALPLLLGRYSFFAPLSVGGLVGLIAYLDTYQVCQRTVTRLSANRARCGATSTLIIQYNTINNLYSAAIQLVQER